MKIVGLREVIGMVSRGQYRVTRHGLLLFAGRANDASDPSASPDHTCQDRSNRPRRLDWKATEEEHAIVCQLRRSTGFGLDDLTFVVRHFLPYLKRDTIWRILKDAGLNRLPLALKSGAVRGQGKFRDYDPGYVHIDVKHLPKLQTADGPPGCRHRLD